MSTPDSTSDDVATLSPGRPSINALEEIEPGASNENQGLVVGENDSGEINSWGPETELHLPHSDGVKNLARLMRSVSVMSDEEQTLTKHRTVKSAPSTRHPSGNQEASNRHSTEFSEAEHFVSTESRLEELNELVPENGGLTSDTPTTSLTSEISDTGLFNSIDSNHVTLDEDHDVEADFLNSEAWRRKPRHFFILTEAGKPVYSRHGSEDKLAPLMGVLLALVSCVYDRKDTIRFVVAGEHKFVFMPRLPLILVAVCSTRESVSQVQVQLNYLCNTIISVLTYSQLSKIYETKKNFDLRRLLTGTDKFLHNLCDKMDLEPQFLLQAVQCLRVSGNTRDIIGQALQLTKTEDLAFAILISHNKLVNICRLKELTLHASDLHLILNLVTSSSTAFHTGESWTPICLPSFNPNGFLHAHISYLDEDLSTCLILLSADRDSFFTLSEAKNRMIVRLKKNYCLESLQEAGKLKSYTVESIGINSLRHFIYKSKSTLQFTCPEIGYPYNIVEEKSRIFGLYQHTHGRIHDTNASLKLLYLICETEVILGWLTSGFELYAIFSPLVTKNSAIAAVNRLLKWIKKQEDELFILRPPIF